jgi:hypothetical protein
VVLMAHGGGGLFGEGFVMAMVALLGRVEIAEVVPPARTMLLGLLFYVVVVIETLVIF